MLDVDEPGFHSALRKWEQPEGQGHSVWLIQHSDRKHYWGVARHKNGDAVGRWHGPFAQKLAAQSSLEAARDSRGWPLNSI
jgi:hypothetical protein